MAKTTKKKSTTTTKAAGFTKKKLTAKVAGGSRYAKAKPGGQKTAAKR